MWVTEKRPRTKGWVSRVVWGDKEEKRRVDRNEKGGTPQTTDQGRKMKRYGRTEPNERKGERLAGDRRFQRVINGHKDLGEGAHSRRVIYPQLPTFGGTGETGKDGGFLLLS